MGKPNASVQQGNKIWKEFDDTVPLSSRSFRYAVIERVILALHITMLGAHSVASNTRATVQHESLYVVCRPDLALTSLEDECTIKQKTYACAQTEVYRTY
jgi:hypothetical protein